MWWLNGGCYDRQRNGINARSNVDIWRADHDLYLACIDQKVGCLRTHTHCYILIRKLAVMVWTICTSWQELSCNQQACCVMQVFVKLGPRYDLGDQCPQEKDGWKFALSGPDFAIWEKQ